MRTPESNAIRAAAARTARKRQSVAVENPGSCPKCGKAWVFLSDAPFGIGLIRAVHPPGRCIPVVYEPEPLPVKDAKPRPCAICKAVFTPETGKHGKKRTCSPSCARTLTRRQRRDYYLNVQRERLNREVRAYQRRQGSRRAA